MPIILRISYSLILCILCLTATSAQTTSKKIKYEVEAGTYLSSTSTNPFWIRSNQFGEIPLESQGFTLRAQVKKEYEPYLSPKKGKGKFSYGYGARAVLNAGRINQVLLSELYGKVRYGAVELSAGRRRKIIGLVDSTLSSGSYIWSGNALPMPSVEISIPNYTPIFKNGLVAVKGNYLHGWFGRNDSLDNSYLHQKSLYIRLGKPSWRFKIYGGFNHQVQWGGTLLYNRFDNGVKITRYGTDWETYQYVVTGKSLYELDTLVVQNGAASAEGGNRVGNHLGSLDLGLEYETENSRWLFYRQSFYEAGALFYLNNVADGLNGISFVRKNAQFGILRVVFEYLQTSSQGGPVASGRTTISQLRGAEDYFNNGRYIDGWVYKGQTIGTPYIMPLRYTSGLPQNLDRNPNRIVNNRVEVYTLGIMSRIGNVDLLTRFTSSQNFGNYYYPAFSISQKSFQQQFIIPLNKYTFTVNLAYDSEGVLQENYGLNFLVKRTF
ncbi:capsule assembly Wzi family protein [Spirosoma flavus]